MNRPNGDFSDGDDISLDGELARQMFDESAALRDPVTENLRLQAAKTSEEVFSRYIEELKQQMESSFDKISTKLSDLDRKYNELTQQVHSRPGDQTCVQTSSLNQNFDQNLQNLESMQVGAPMEVDKSLNDAPINVSQPEPSTAPSRNSNLFLRPYEQAQTSSLRDEQYRSRKIDAVKFRPLDKKLESEEQFKYWRRSIVGQIETQECAFLIDPSEKIPPAFSNNELGIAERKARWFISESLSPYFQDLIQDLSCPKDILDKLQKACDPSSAFQLKRLIHDFNSIRFDPQFEKAIDFLAKFDDTRKKIVCLNPEMLTPEYVKLIFESAIEGTVTYSKAELHEFKFSMAEMRDMLLEEQIRGSPNASMGGSSLSIVRKKSVPTRGRGEMKRGRGSKGAIPGKNLPARENMFARSKIAKRRFCDYCKIAGHTNSFCFKAKKICFNCRKSDQHLAANCPMPSKLSPAQKSVSNKHFEQNKPKLVKMPMKKAKILSEKFKSSPDAIFAIAGPSDLPDTENVWVTLGGEEERLISETNLLRETGETEDIVAYSDSSLGTSAVNGRSTTGYSVKLFGDLVSWKSKKQAHVALSTCEAEYIAMSEA
ncbi:unnamed protein product, partial [Nesidiocoris tenuis]